MPGRGHSATMPPFVKGRTCQRVWSRPVYAHVTHHHAVLLARLAVQGQAQRLTHAAVSAIRAHQVLRAKGLLRAVADDPSRARKANPEDALLLETFRRSRADVPDPELALWIIDTLSHAVIHLRYVKRK